MSNEQFVPGTEIEKPQVKLSDGNAFAVIGACQRVLRRAGVPKEKIEEFQTEATSGDYDNVLRTAMKWCEVDLG